MKTDDRQISLSAPLSANAFLSPDRLLDFDKVLKLNERIAAVVKTIEAKTGSEVPVTQYYVLGIKAKPTNYSAALEKKDDLKYHTLRSTKVAIRKRIRPDSLARVKILLTMISGPGVPAPLLAQLKDAGRAIEAHMKRIVKTKVIIAKKKGVVRDANAADFDSAVAKIKSVLLAGGLKESSFVESSGMFGKQVLVKLDSDSVISIGKADLKRFNVARKAAAQTSESSASSSDVSVIVDVDEDANEDALRQYIKDTAADNNVKVKFLHGDQAKFWGPKKLLQAALIEYYNSEKTAKAVHPELFK